MDFVKEVLTSRLSPFTIGFADSKRGGGASSAGRGTKTESASFKARAPPPEYKAPPNPGKYDELTKESKDTLGLGVESFEGFRLDVQRGVSENFGLMHQIAIAQRERNEPPASYQLLAHYASGHGYTLLGRVASGGDFMARYVHEFSKKLTWMVGSNIQKGPKGEEATQVDGDITYKGSDFTASAKASYGISPQGEQTMLGFNYTQGITKHLSAGVDTIIVPQEPIAHIMATGRYESKDSKNHSWIATASASTMMNFETTYTHIFGSKFRLGTSFSLSRPPYSPKPQLTPLFMVGYSYDVEGPQGSGTGISVKGSITNLKVVQSHLEEHLNPMMAINVTTSINYPKDVYKFGFGLNFAL